MIEDSDTGRIERELDDTRARLDATIGALRSKLEPEEMVEQAVTYFKEGGGVEFRRNLEHTVRANPMPLALIGVGVGWLILANARRDVDSGNDWRGRPWMRDNRYGGGTDYDMYGRGGVRSARGIGHEAEMAPHQPMPYEAAAYDDLATKAQEAGSRVQREAEDTDETFQDRVDAARGSVLGVVRRAGEAAASFRDRVEAAFAAAADRVRQVASDAGDSASSIAERGQAVAGRLYDYGSSATSGLRDRAGQARDLGNRTVDYVQEHPLLLGALGVTVGVGIGLLVPPSRYERELAGSVRDNLGEAAREHVTDLASRTRHVVEETATAGREALQREFSGNGQSDQQDKAGNRGSGLQEMPRPDAEPITGT